MFIHRHCGNTGFSGEKQLSGEETQVLAVNVSLALTEMAKMRDMRTLSRVELFPKKVCGGPNPQTVNVAYLNIGSLNM